MTMSYIHYAPIVIFLVLILLLKALAYACVFTYFLTKGMFKLIRWTVVEVIWLVRSAHRYLVTHAP